jgi:hypothetical protein
LLAANLIANKTDQRKDGVEMIASLLGAYHSGSDWSRAHYGAMAVKASLADGDLSKAKHVLELALQAEPQDAQLKYLARLILRAETAQLAAAKPIKLSKR